MHLNESGAVLPDGIVCGNVDIILTTTIWRQSCVFVQVASCLDGMLLWLWLVPLP